MQWGEEVEQRRRVGAKVEVGGEEKGNRRVLY